MKRKEGLSLIACCHFIIIIIIILSFISRFVSAAEKVGGWFLVTVFQVKLVIKSSLLTAARMIHFSSRVTDRVLGHASQSVVTCRL